MWKAVAIGVAVSGVQACAPSIRPVETVLAEVQRDEVASAATMRGQSVGLTGRVKQKGLKTEREFAFAFAAVHGIGVGKMREVDTNVGYVELASTSGKPAGHALCLFEPEAFDWLATVQEGQAVKIACEFVSVEGTRPERYPVFRRCWVQY